MMHRKRKGKGILNPSQQHLHSTRLRKKRNVIELGPPQFQPKQGASYHPFISPTANISLQLPGPQNERRFHFMSVISRPVCYLCGDKCLTDWERR